MRFEAKLGIFIGLVLGASLPPIIERVGPLLRQPIALAPSIFHPLFIALVMAVFWMQWRQTRELHREAAARGQTRNYWWVSVGTTLVIGGLAYWLIGG